MIAFLQRFLPKNDAGIDAAAGDERDDPSLLRSLQLQGTVDLVLPGSPATDEGRDFGGIYRSSPAAVVRPATADDVAKSVRLVRRSASFTVAARGNGHSINGQAMAEGGLVVDMRPLAEMELVPDRSGTGSASVRLGGGALWEDVLTWCVENHRMAPLSWTDYLGLTVGGTLSNGGISGQAFRHGPQTSNVSELEIVTGEGDSVVCSESLEPDLFFAALGGLGQFGIITGATIPLQPAPDLVRWIRVVYGDFEEYASDAECLVSRADDGDSFDYVEGFAFVNGDDPINGWDSVPIEPGQRFDSGRVPSGAGPVLYCLEVALHYHRRRDGAEPAHSLEKRMEEMLRPLRYVRGLEFSVDTSYVEFLTRVNRAEEAARAKGIWDAAHPWLNLLVAKADIVDFDRNVFKGVLRNGIGGPMLVYPLLKSKWDPRTSVALPDSEIFYLIALLRFSLAYPEGPSVKELVAQNQEIINCCMTNGYDFKLYLPHYKTEEQWKRHFGKQWSRFVERKASYDPDAILAPGQRIFQRAHQRNLKN